jgi:transglutaminase-like putative cysteine protease
MSTVYRVTHRTHYQYAKPVTASYGQLHLLPRELAGQRLRRAEVVVDPQPERYRERIDFFGNRASYFAINEPHQQLTVTATSVVEVEDLSQELSLFGERPWELVRDVVAAGDPTVAPDVIQYVLDSPLVAGHQLYREYAQPSFPPGASAIDGIAALCSRIFDDFKYAPGSTSVSTPLAEAFAKRKGVCQDFAHVAIACLRALGLPARYVSGYLETKPAPGKPKLTGVDGSHAWLSVYVPDAGWVAVDPTNDQFANGRYVVTAIGRDYSDVPPMNGVIYTEGKTEKLEVQVDVVALDNDDQMAA